MSKRKVCLIHEDDWAGEDVEYSMCIECKVESKIMTIQMLAWFKETTYPMT